MIGDGLLALCDGLWSDALSLALGEAGAQLLDITCLQQPELVSDGVLGLCADRGRLCGGLGRAGLGVDAHRERFGALAAAREEEQAQSAKS